MGDAVTMTSAEAARLLLRARIAGRDYPPEVPDTPRYRQLWDEIGADLDTMPPGVVPMIPAG